MIKSICYLLVLASLSFNALGQSTTDDNDSTQLSLEAFLKGVEAYHPLMRQAKLQSGFGEAELKIAKGGFDPKLSSNFDIKNLKDLEYYNIFNTSVKVPTNFFIDPKISVDRNKGEFLNRERTISDKTDNLQMSIGASLPLGRGLITDKRRTALQQAKVFQNLTEVQQTNMVNKLVLKVCIDYWNWFYAYEQLRLIESSLGLSNEIKRRTLLDFGFGEASVVDTIQATINVNTMNLELQEARNEFIEKRLSLSVHAWNGESTPVEIKETAFPQSWAEEVLTLGVINIDSILNNINSHPELLKVTYKGQQLELENKLNKENLKPKLDLSYSVIDVPVNLQGESNELIFLEDYKFGVDFEIPLFLRKERGKILKTQLKIESNEFELANKTRQVEAKVRTQYQQLLNARKILEQSGALTDNYKTLLDAEFLNLETGESDLFKINIQQEKYLNARRKLLKSQVNYQKNKAYLYYASGTNFLDRLR